MAKIGQLYSEPRRWNDNQLVTAEWVDESTAVYNHWDKLLYGYLWWIIDENEHSYAAMGDVGTGFKD